MHFELGRSVVGQCGSLITRVLYVKNGVQKKFAIVDAGINLAYPITWEYHEILIANKMNSNCKDFYSIAGPICTPSDVLCKSKKLPLFGE